MEGEVSPNRKKLLLIDNLDSAISTIEQWETEEGFKECVRDRYIKNNPKLENIRIELESYLDVQLKESLRQLEHNFKNAKKTLEVGLEQFSNEIEEIGNKPVRLKPGQRILGQKVHTHKTPLLHIMMKQQDIRTIYNIFVAIMFVFTIGEMITNYNQAGYLLDLSLVTDSFGMFNYVIAFWIFMYLWANTVVLLVQVIIRNNLSKPVWILLYSIQLSVMLIVPSTFTIYLKLPSASGLTIGCEMCRMFMKMHSYLREKLMFAWGDNQYVGFIPDALKEKGLTIEDLNFPKMDLRDIYTELCRFGYFMFCPTLIYRDSYPRLPYRRWKNIFKHMLHMVGSITYAYIILQTFCIPMFDQTPISTWDSKFFIRCLLKSMVPGTMLLILLFFGFLHSWQTMWAEFLHFADRRFYLDWWNVSSFATYYTKWNIVVHEWLFQYIMQDGYRFTQGQISQKLSFSIVFVFSALLHEVIIILGFRMFYPVLLLLFGGPGVLFTILPKNDSRLLNIFVWSMLLVGNGLLVVLYSCEYFARLQIDLTCVYGWVGWLAPHSYYVFAGYDLSLFR